MSLNICKFATIKLKLSECYIADSEMYHLNVKLK